MILATTTERRDLDDGDYRQMTSHELIILSHIYSLFPFRVAAHCLRLQGGELQSVLRDAGEIVRSSDVERLRQLSDDSEIVTHHFIDWKFRRMAIETVIAQRLKQFPFSSDLLDFEEGRLGEKWIDEMVKTILPLGKGSYADWQDPQDVDLFAVDAAVDAHQLISNQYVVTHPGTKLPALPCDLNIPVNDPEPYNRLVPRWFCYHLNEALKKWKPILDGIIETEGVQIAKTKVESEGRQVRRNKSRRVCPSPGSADIASDVDFIENIERQANRTYEGGGKIQTTVPREGDKYPDGERIKTYRPAGIDPIMTNPSVPDEEAIVKEQDDQKVNAVLTQFGEQVREYLRLRGEEDLKQKDAAAKVGVSVATARRWEVAFKKKYKQSI